MACDDVLLQSEDNNMTPPTPMTFAAIFMLIVIIGGFGYMAIRDVQFKANAPIVCEQIIDKTDMKVIQVRTDNYIDYTTTYHGYDVCRSRDGTIVSNISLGYGTEIEFMIYGLAKK